MVVDCCDVYFDCFVGGDGVECVFEAVDLEIVSEVIQRFVGEGEQWKRVLERDLRGCCQRAVVVGDLEDFALVHDCLEDVVEIGAVVELCDAAMWQSFLEYFGEIVR